MAEQRRLVIADDTPPDTTTPPAKEPSFLDKLKGWVPSIVRGATGLAAFEGNWPGAVIAGAGEAGAELLEGDTPDWKRVGVEASLGAVPFGKVFKAGRPVASALRGALYAGTGEAMREGAKGESLNPVSIGSSAALSGAMNAGLAKLLGLGKAASAIEHEGAISGPSAKYPTKASYEATKAADLPNPVAVAKQTVADRVARMPKEEQRAIPRLEDNFNTAIGKKRADIRNREDKLTDLFSTNLAKKNVAMDAEAKALKLRAGMEPGNVSSRDTYSFKNAEGGTSSSSQRYKPRELEEGVDVASTGETYEQVKDRVLATEPPVEEFPPSNEFSVARAKKAADAEFKTAQQQIFKETGDILPREMEVPPSVIHIPEAGLGEPVPTIKTPDVKPQEPSAIAKFFKTHMEAAGPHYDEVQAAFKAGEVPKEGARVAGRALQREAKAAGLPTKAKAKAFSPDVAPEAAPEDWIQRELADVEARKATPPVEGPVERPAWTKLGRNPGESNESFIDRLRKMADEDRGAISPMLAARLGLGAAGAAVGGATDPLENRPASILAGGMAGAAAPSAIQALTHLGAPKEALEHATEAGITVEGIKKAATKIFNLLPQVQRFSLLASTEGLAANAIVGPYGSAVMGALEHGLSGDQRGWTALRELARVDEYLKGFVTNWSPARKLMQGSKERASELATGHLTSNLGQRVEATLSAPGTLMTAGDETARRILESAGFSDAEARRITLTSEPIVPLARHIVDIGRESALGQLIAPFRRTTMNIGEQGAQRTPGAGFIMHGATEKAGAEPDTYRQKLVQQGLGAVVGSAGYVAGANVDPETGKTVRRFGSNATGQYSLPFSIGFGAGQAVRRGKSKLEGGVAGALTGFPLPTTQPITDWAKFLADPLEGRRLDMNKFPKTMIPKFLQQNISSHLPNFSGTETPPTQEDTGDLIISRVPR